MDSMLPECLRASRRLAHVLRRWAERGHQLHAGSEGRTRHHDACGVPAQRSLDDRQQRALGAAPGPPARQLVSGGVPAEVGELEALLEDAGGRPRGRRQRREPPELGQVAAGLRRARVGVLQRLAHLQPREAELVLHHLHGQGRAAPRQCHRLAGRGPFLLAGPGAELPRGAVGQGAGGPRVLGAACLPRARPGRRGRRRGCHGEEGHGGHHWSDARRASGTPEAT
mmetsp:Transcript_22292/g.58175  ORF Transcript_22292/g.58175 Transcript_22292/m.58175 type:complete len:226 (-) Transcript_22292:2-679(-)